jgi:glycosyltransferase involved in cell wall biosynthesis
MLVVQPAIFSVLFGGYAALVIGHEMKYVSNLVLMVAFRLAGKPVLFWGFGPSYDPDDLGRGRMGRLLTKVLSACKTTFIRMATDFMTYTESGAAFVARAGLPPDRITVLWNTIDISAEITAHDAMCRRDRAEVRRSLGLSPDAVVLLFLGRLLASKRVDLLLKAGRAVRQRCKVPIEIMIVGDGVEAERLRAEFERDPNVHFAGAIYETERLAAYLYAADALVIPGFVGLAVNQAFAHGLPVVTCASDLHSPEIEYVMKDVNGLILDGEEGLVDGLVRLAETPELRRTLAEGALATRERLDLRRMVVGFDGAVARALGRGKPR